MILLSQQGSGSRFLLQLLNEHSKIISMFDEPIDRKPPIGEKSVLNMMDKWRDIIVPIKFNHLEPYKKVQQRMKQEKIILLRRDPARTFTRQMAKYKEKETWTRQDLVDHVKYVRRWYKKVENWPQVMVVDYEAWGTRDKPLDEIPELQMSYILDFIGVDYERLRLKENKHKLWEHIL